MHNKDYIIPNTIHNDEAINSSETLISSDDFEHMENYLGQVEANEMAKRRYEKSLQALEIGQLVERVRMEHIHGAMLSSKKPRISAIVDQLLPGGSNTKFDASTLWGKLVDREALLGGELLDTKDSENHYYHYHDQNEWFWYAENKYSNQAQTVRYKVEVGDVKRSLNGDVFVSVSEAELDNFLEVSSLYQKHVLVKIYARADLV